MATPPLTSSSRFAHKRGASALWLLLSMVRSNHCFSPSSCEPLKHRTHMHGKPTAPFERAHTGHYHDQHNAAEGEAGMHYSPNAPPDECIPQSGENSDAASKDLAFFDEAEILVRGGSGGQGSSTYKRGKGGSDGIPDGGNGGRGGDVLMVADGTLNTLAGLTLPNSSGDRLKSFRAGTGRDGGRQFDNGRNGDHVEIRVPPGTAVQQQVDVRDGEGSVVRTELVEVGQVTLQDPVLVVARGGAGGDGSGVTRRAAVKGKSRRRAPPAAGERKRLKLVLKLVADIALVGVPNAGKSTFLASVTRAKPKIANYPFTTVIPNLGVWVPPESDYASEASNGLTSGAGSTGIVLCDVPGLVAGAAEGVGLGHAFLRHVERCHVILHLVDATSDNAVADFIMLNRELKRYGTGQLANMPQVVVVNKVDAYEEGYAEESEQGLKMRLSKFDLKTQLDQEMQHSRLMWVSAKEKEGVNELMGRMAKFVSSIKEKKAQADNVQNKR